MPFKLKDVQSGIYLQRTGLYAIFPDEEYGYSQSTNPVDGDFFEFFDDESVYGNDTGCVAIKNLTTGKFVRELYYRLFDNDFIPNDIGFAFKVKRGDVTGTIALEGQTRGAGWYVNTSGTIFGKSNFVVVYGFDPVIKSGSIVSDDTSVKFEGEMTFDGTLKYKLLPTIEYVKPYDFTYAVTFDYTPSNVRQDIFTKQNFVRLSVDNNTTTISFNNDQLSSNITTAPYVKNVLYVYTQNGKINATMNDTRLTFTPTNNQPSIDYVYTPTVLGSNVNYFTGNVYKFEEYNYFVDSSVIKGYEYGSWGPFDSNVNTFFKISSNVYEKTTIQDGYIVNTLGSNVVTNTLDLSNGFSVSMRVSNISSGGYYLLDMRTADFIEFSQGSAISVYHFENSLDFKIEYTTNGRLTTVISENFSLNSDTQKFLYFYITKYGKLDGNFINHNSFSPYSLKSTEYTIYTNTDECYIYDKILPENAFFKYEYSGTKSTLTTDGPVAGEFLDIGFGRQLAIRKIDESFKNNDIVSIKYYGSTNDGFLYEPLELGPDKKYTNARLVVDKNIRQLIPGNYVIEYDSSGIAIDQYKFAESGSLKVITDIGINADGYRFVSIQYGPRGIKAFGKQFKSTRNKTTNTVLVCLDPLDSYEWSSIIYVEPTTANLDPVSNPVLIQSIACNSDRVVISVRISVRNLNVYVDDDKVPLRKNSQAYIMYEAKTGKRLWICYVDVSNTIYGSLGDIYKIAIDNNNNTSFMMHYDAGPLIDSTGTSIATSYQNSTIMVIDENGVFVKKKQLAYYTTIVFSDGGGNYYTSSLASLYSSNKLCEKYDSDFNLQWSVTSNGGNNQAFLPSSMFTKNGYVYGIAVFAPGYSVIDPFGSYSVYPITDSVVQVLKIDTSNGSLARVYSITNSNGNADLCVDDDGSVYVSACSNYGDLTMNFYNQGTAPGVDLTSYGYTPLVGGTKGLFTGTAKYNPDGSIAWTLSTYIDNYDIITGTRIYGNDLYITVNYGADLASSKWTTGTSAKIVIVNKNTGVVKNTIYVTDGGVPDYNSINSNTSTWKISGICKKIGDVTLDSNATLVVSDSKIPDYTNYEILFRGTVSNVVTGLETFVQKTSVDQGRDIYIERITYTPYQVVSTLSSNITEQSIYTLGANYETHIEGIVDYSNLFESREFGKGYGFIKSYDGVVAPVSNIILEGVKLYDGQEPIVLQSTGEASVFIDDELAIQGSGSNTCSYGNHSIKVVYTNGNLEPNYAYISLDGISNIYPSVGYPTNGMHYAKTARGQIQTPFLLSGNGVCISNTVTYTGYLHQNYNYSNINTNAAYSFSNVGNAYTLTFTRASLTDTYAYDPSFRSLLYDSANVIASNITIYSNISELSTTKGLQFVRSKYQGKFTLPETGKYNVYALNDSYTYNETTNPIDINSLDYTVFGTSDTSYQMDAGEIVPFTLDYYHTTNPDYFMDLKFVHQTSGNAYMLSGYTFSDVNETKISNFYKSNVAVANYNVI